MYNKKFIALLLLMALIAYFVYLCLIEDIGRAILLVIMFCLGYFTSGDK